MGFGEFDRIANEFREFEIDMMNFVLKTKLEEIKNTVAVHSQTDLFRVFSSYDFNTPDVDKKMISKFREELATLGYRIEVDYQRPEVDRVGYELKFWFDPRQYKVKLLKEIIEV